MKWEKQKNGLVVPVLVDDDAPTLNFHAYETQGIAVGNAAAVFTLTRDDSVARVFTHGDWEVRLRWWYSGDNTQRGLLARKDEAVADVQAFTVRSAEEGRVAASALFMEMERTRQAMDGHPRDVEASIRSCHAMWEEATQLGLGWPLVMWHPHFEP